MLLHHHPFCLRGTGPAFYMWHRAIRWQAVAKFCTQQRFQRVLNIVIYLIEFLVGNIQSRSLIWNLRCCPLNKTVRECSMQSEISPCWASIDWEETAVSWSRIITLTYPSVDFLVAVLPVS